MQLEAGNKNGGNFKKEGIYKTAEFFKIQKQQEPKDVIVCPVCKKELNKQEVIINKYVCYECGSYFRVRTANRIKMTADRESFVPCLGTRRVGRLRRQIFNGQHGAYRR